MAAIRRPDRHRGNALGRGRSERRRRDPLAGDGPRSPTAPTPCRLETDRGRTPGAPAGMAPTRPCSRYLVADSAGLRDLALVEVCATTSIGFVRHELTFDVRADRPRRRSRRFGSRSSSSATGRPLRDSSACDTAERPRRSRSELSVPGHAGASRGPTSTRCRGTGARRRGDHREQRARVRGHRGDATSSGCLHDLRSTELGRALPPTAS